MSHVVCVMLYKYGGMTSLYLYMLDVFVLAGKNTKIGRQVRTIKKEENILPGNNLTHDHI